MLLDLLTYFSFLISTSLCAMSTSRNTDEVDALIFNEQSAKQLFFIDTPVKRDLFVYKPFPSDHEFYCSEAISLLRKYDFIDDSYSPQRPPADVKGYVVHRTVFTSVLVPHYIMRVCSVDDRGRVILISYNHRPECPGYFYYKLHGLVTTKSDIYGVHLWNYLQSDLKYEVYGKYKNRKKSATFDELKFYVKTNFGEKLKAYENSLELLRGDGKRSPNEIKNLELEYSKFYEFAASQVKVLGSHLSRVSYQRLLPEKMNLEFSPDDSKSLAKKRDIVSSMPSCSSDDTSGSSKTLKNRSRRSMSFDEIKSFVDEKYAPDFKKLENFLRLAYESNENPEQILAIERKYLKDYDDIISKIKKLGSHLEESECRRLFPQKREITTLDVDGCKKLERGKSASSSERARNSGKITAKKDGQKMTLDEIKSYVSERYEWQLEAIESSLRDLYGQIKTKDTAKTISRLEEEYSKLHKFVIFEINELGKHLNRVELEKLFPEKIQLRLPAAGDAKAFKKRTKVANDGPGSTGGRY